MKNYRCMQRHHTTCQAGSDPRQGAFIILAVFCLIACFAFAALSVDVGYLGVTKTRMQNSVDAAALAAVQEIANAVRNAPPGTEDVTAYALDEARNVAANVAELNGVYIDPATDVEFGQRTYDADTQTYTINWGVTPANAVKVTARRTGEDVTQPDGKLRLFFSGISGSGFAHVTTEAIAYVEARDMVVVHDFSRSMNFDSQFSDEAVSRLSSEQIETNLRLLWEDLLAQNINFGNLQFDPQYLTMTDQRDGVTTSVTFQYDDVVVSTTGELVKVKLVYTNDSSDTFYVSGDSAELHGDRNVKSVYVTTQGEGEEAEEVTISKSGINAEFSSDRKEVSIQSNSKLSSIYILFQDGSTDYYSLNNQKRVNISENDPIDKIWLDKRGGGTNWIEFDPPNSGSGSGDTVEQYFEDNDQNVKACFGLDNVPYPFPSGSWNDFIDHCRTYSPLAENGYREMYGGLSMANYLVRERSSHAETPALAQARHYPFTSIKQGHSLLCDFLENLGFDDELGMVSYDTYHRVETVLNENDPNIPQVDISDDPISKNFEAVNNLMKYKQANHYYPATNMGGGLKEAIQLLEDHARAGTRPTILLMTDGNSNTMDWGESSSLPHGWDWDELLDYDGDGSADYYTNSGQSRYVLKKAYEAYEAGYTVHAMSVGQDADRDLLRAVAHIGGGVFIDVPGGSSVADMEDQILAGFYKIASQVPPAKLISNPQ